MEKIARFFECLIPVTACNLKCSYCYVIQRDNRKNKMASMKYSPKQIGEALTKERLGGVCYFSICGAGETTLQIGIEDVIYEILNQGHYVNVTTNGTVTKRIKEIVNRSKAYISRMHFSFSFHYIELLDRNLMDIFFENVNWVKSQGASVLVQINLCDEYIPYLDDIKARCIEKVGAMPQVAATRKEEKGLGNVELLTELSQDEYMKLGKQFESPLFEFTMKNFNVKRKEFCYAGDWSGTLDLSTGILRRCYSSYIFQDIFKNPKEKIRFLAMGNCCGSPFCMNSSHFMSWGIIPSVSTPTYGELRNRQEASWYNDNMEMFSSTKLEETNKQYGILKKLVSNLIGCLDRIIRTAYRTIKRIRCNR